MRPPEEMHCARRVKVGGSIVIRPPKGHGEAWAGSATGPST